MRKYTYHKIERPKSLRAMMKRAAELYGDRIMYVECDGKYAMREYTYRDTINRTYALATALWERGMVGKHFALLGENCRDWVVSYLAVMTGIGVLLPMDIETPSNDLAHLLNKGDVDALICTTSQIEKVKAILPDCPGIKTLISIGIEPQEGFIPIGSLVAEGRRLINEGDDYVTSFEPNLDNVALICFTSGTTGPNKGVMLSQRNILGSLVGAISVNKPGECGLSVLPMQHTYEAICHIWTSMYWGATVCFNDALKNLMWNIERYKPTIMCVVPLFLETICKNIKLEVTRNGMKPYFDKGVFWSNFLMRFGIDLRRKIFKPVLMKFGGRLTKIVSGGAHLNTDVEQFFRTIGIDILNGYGITECSPMVTGSCTGWQIPGSVGFILPDEQIKILEPDEDGVGEICVKGPNVFKGYYKDREATKQTFTEDGWFRTGDMGYITRRGILYLSGRKKNLIVLSNGKNVHPEEVEQRLFSSMPYVKDGMVFALNEGNNPVICFSVVLDTDNAAAYGITDFDKRLKDDVDAVNETLPAYKQVKRINVRSEDFVKTPTKKIKRSDPKNQEVSFND